MMPSHVKAFWWLSVATVACWAYSDISAVWHMILFPSAKLLALAARMAQQHPDIQRFFEIEITVIPVILCGATLSIAWLAAGHHKNWARWIAALLLLHNQILFLANLLIFAGLHAVQPITAMYTKVFWVNPLSFMIPAIPLGASIAAIALIFSGNARDWFKQSVTAKRAHQ